MSVSEILSFGMTKFCSCVGVTDYLLVSIITKTLLRVFIQIMHIMFLCHPIFRLEMLPFSVFFLANAPADTPILEPTNSYVQRDFPAYILTTFWQIIIFTMVLFDNQVIKLLRIFRYNWLNGFISAEHSADEEVACWDLFNQ